MRLFNSLQLFSIFKTGWSIKLIAQQKQKIEIQHGREMTSDSFWNDIRLTHQQRMLFERKFSENYTIFP